MSDAETIIGAPGTAVALGATEGRPRPRRDPLLFISALVCLALVVLAVVGPELAPYSPSETATLEANQGASSEHLLGTDELGRDILSRVLEGARVSLGGAFLIVLISAVAGTALAIAGVWFGGRFETISVRSMDIFFAFPGLLVAIGAVAIFGTGLVAPVIALSIAYTPYIGRIVRSVARRERDLPYIDACRMAGLSGWRICGRHLVPNVLPVVVAQATISFGSALVDLAAISFLGLGLQPPSTDWGLMISEGTTALLNGYPQQCLAAGVAIIVTVVSFNVLGERLARRAEAPR